MFCVDLGSLLEELLEGNRTEQELCHSSTSHLLNQFLKRRQAAANHIVADATGQTEIVVVALTLDGDSTGIRRQLTEIPMLVDVITVLLRCGQRYHAGGRGTIFLVAEVIVWAEVVVVRHNARVEAISQYDTVHCVALRHPVRRGKAVDVTWLPCSGAVHPLPSYRALLVFSKLSRAAKYLLHGKSAAIDLRFVLNPAIDGFITLTEPESMNSV